MPPYANFRDRLFNIFRKHLRVDLGTDMMTAISSLSLNGLKSEIRDLIYK